MKSIPAAKWQPPQAAAATIAMVSASPCQMCALVCVLTRDICCMQPWLPALWVPTPRTVLLIDCAGVLVLEELEHAKARGARIYAEYVGGAFTCDAHHMTEPQPQGRGVSTCIQKALQSAGMCWCGMRMLGCLGPARHATQQQREGGVFTSSALPEPPKHARAGQWLAGFNITGSNPQYMFASGCQPDDRLFRNSAANWCTSCVHIRLCFSTCCCAPVM
jgi:hypothetical protein